MSRVQIIKLNSEQNWEPYHQIKKKELFESLPHIVYDPNHPCYLSDIDHHFLITVDDAAMGILQLQLCNKNTAILRSIAVKKALSKRGFGTLIMQFAHLWLQLHQVKEVYLHSRPEVVEFYQRLGYQEKSFEDDEGILAESVDMVKYL